MIKLFIFDMGGVLARNVNILPEAASQLGVEESFFTGRMKNELVGLMEGRLGTKSFWEAFNRISGKKSDRELWGELFRPERDGEMESLIGNLKKSGFQVVCGTNTIAEHYDIHRKRGDYGVFDRVYASHLIGAAKPRREFFDIILSGENSLPGEALFTDDLPENVRAAEAAGIRSLLFRDARSFLADLRGIGIAGSTSL